MKILILGNAGFIGNYLTRSLLREGHEITGLDIKDAVHDISGFNHINGDICDKEVIAKAVKGIDLIIHLAAMHQDFGVTREEYFRVNEGGTRNVLYAASKAGVKKFIFFSSVAVYGKNEADEDTHPKPINDYGKSKLAAENAIKEWFHQDESRSVIIIRPTVVFGINNFANMYNLIDKVIRRKFVWVGNGQNIKSSAYIENINDFTVFLINRMTSGYEVFNYCDEPLTTRQIIEKITKYSGTSVPNFKIPFGIAKIGGKIIDLAANLTGINFPITGARIEKFRTKTYFKSKRIQKLGWKRPFSLDEGFKKTIEWYLLQKKR